MRPLILTRSANMTGPSNTYRVWSMITKHAYTSTKDGRITGIPSGKACTYSFTCWRIIFFRLDVSYLFHCSPSVLNFTTLLLQVLLRYNNLTPYQSRQLQRGPRYCFYFNPEWIQSHSDNANRIKMLSIDAVNDMPTITICTPIYSSCSLVGGWFYSREAFSLWSGFHLFIEIDITHSEKTVGGRKWK